MNHNISKKDIRRLASYALRFRALLFLGIFLLVLSVLFGILSPFLIKYIFDTELPKSPLELRNILILSASFLLSEIAGISLKYIGNLQLQKIALSVVRDMREEMFISTQRQEIPFFDNLPAGKILSQITNDTAAVGDLYVTVLSQFLSSAVYIVGIFAALFWIDAAFALLCILLILLFYGIVLFYTRTATPHNHIIRDRISDLNAMMNESIQGIAIIQSFNGQSKMQEDFEKINADKLRSEMKLLTLESALSHNIIGFLRGFAMTLMFLFFGISVLKNGRTVGLGIVYVYMHYLGLLFQQSYGIFDKMPQLQRSVVAAKHVFAFIDREGKTDATEPVGEVQGGLCFEHVSFAYKEEDYVLKDISFSLEAGQTLRLVGHTGSGKSSVLNLLMKFYEPQKGEIFIDRQRLSRLSAKSIRKYLGIVLQEPYLFSGTVLDNIRLGNPEISREQALKALQSLGGDLVLQDLARGIDENISERGSNLSAGQRQLISFARALAHNPRILILDEATSSIDSETEKIIQDAMKVLMANRSTIVIAHRLSTIRHADKIIVLDKGRILEEGNHDSLIAAKGKYYEMYQAQSSRQNIG